MRNIFFAAILIFSSIIAWAQMPGAGDQGTGRVYGKVVDSAGKAISDVSVFILQNIYDPGTQKTKAILLKGILTKSNGEFSLEELPLAGKLELKISAIGFQPYEQEVSFDAEKPGNVFPLGKDLGNIKLQSVDNQLQAVVVTASKPLMQMGIDKKTFRVDRDIVAAGGTAVDVMRNVPSVKVDIDGNVTLRDAPPQIYIDGKPTTLSLDQIPAGEIERIEVITNPSAKYDASGGNAGILNILLKKNEKTGQNGSIWAGIDSRGGFNGGGNFNIRRNKFNFFTSLIANQLRNRITGTTNRYSFRDASAVNILQNNLNKTKSSSLFGRVGVDYFLSNRTTLSLSGIKTYRKFNFGETIDVHTDSILNAGIRSVYSNRLSDEEREMNGTVIQLGLEHNFPNAGEELTADFDFSDMKWNGDGLYATNYPGNSDNVSNSKQQKNLVGGNNRLFTMQADYVKPFSEVTKLEAGFRAQIIDIANKNENYIRRPGAGNFERIAAATTNYQYTNEVYAAYISISSATKKKFGYQLGLRAENSSYTGKVLNTGEKFNNDYPVSLFPSIFLSQKLENSQELQFSITRRTYRPSSFQLTPYTDYTDNLNLTKGNPDLVPEFTSSAEFSYSKAFNTNNNFLTSVYYKYTNNLITRYLIKGKSPVTDEEVYINTFINANSGESYGAELISVNTIRNWWDIVTNINVYNSWINTDNIAYAARDPLWSVFAKLNSNFKLPRNFTIQLSGDYQSKTNLPIKNSQELGRSVPQIQSSSQGYIRAFYGVDMAVKKTFLNDNAASVTLSVNDIFRSRKSDQYSEGAGFTQNYYRLSNPQMIRLNFTYQFGKVDRSLFDRKNMKNRNNESMQDLQ